MSGFVNDLIGAAIDQFDADGFQDGDLVSHEWLKYALDLPEPTSLDDAKRCQFLALSRVEDFKERLLSERKIALQNVRGEGYRVVPPREQAALAAETVGHYLNKGLSQGRRLVSNTRVSVLTAGERRQHDDTAAKMDNFRQMVKRERKSLFASVEE